MARVRFSATQMIAKLRKPDILTGQRLSAVQAVHQPGVNQQTYYRPCKEYAGLKLDHGTRLDKAHVGSTERKE